MGGLLSCSHVHSRSTSMPKRGHLESLAQALFQACDLLMAPGLQRAALCMQGRHLLISAADAASKILGDSNDNALLLAASSGIADGLRFCRVVKTHLAASCRFCVSFRRFIVATASAATERASFA